MTPAEREWASWRDFIAKQHPDNECDFKSVREIIAAGDAALRAAVLAERQACTEAVCVGCASGQPISDADECMTMGHFKHADTCHPYSRDANGKVMTHIRCGAAAIHARSPRA